MQIVAELNRDLQYVREALPYTIEEFLILIHKRTVIYDAFESITVDNFDDMVKDIDMGEDSQFIYYEQADGLNRAFLWFLLTLFVAE